MFSKFIRLGALISSAAILSSCGSSTGQAETQQSTPEGLFTGSATSTPNPAVTVTYTNTPSVPVSLIPAGCTENMLMFVNFAGTFYSFFSTGSSNQPSVVSAASGQMAFSGGTMGSTNVVQVTPPNGGTSPAVPNATYTAPSGSYCNIALTNTNGVNNEVTAPSFTGAYNTGFNLTGTFTYPNAVDTLGPSGDFETATIALGYNPAYQNVQSLATLAGRYSGTVGTSQFSETATFIFSPASVPANSGNQFGVGTVSGTGQSGCTYTGTASPLFKGNGYSLSLTVGGVPCQLAGSNFTGLAYLDTANNYLYSFSPNAAHNDGLIFAGVRK